MAWLRLRKVDHPGAVKRKKGGYVQVDRPVDGTGGHKAPHTTPPKESFAMLWTQKNRRTKI
jgi:hypothetical protein